LRAEALPDARRYTLLRSDAGRQSRTQRDRAEGNGRTARTFRTQVAEHFGYASDFRRIDARVNQASVDEEIASELAPLRTIIREVTVPLRARAFSEALTQGDRTVALWRFPELREAFETLRLAGQRLHPNEGGRCINGAGQTMPKRRRPKVP
jgi:hypothetical protein